MSENYYHTKASVAEYIELAKDVNGAGLISRLKQYLNRGARLLELGSGPGTDYQLLSKDYKVTGSDNSNEFLKHLSTSHPDGQFLKLDAASLTTEEQFDGIYSNKVLHHLTNEQLSASVKRQADILHEGGIICHSFWKGEGDELFKGLYVNYHNEAALKQFFGGQFEMLLVESYAEFEEGDSLLLLASKKNS